jgi:hypothetical protein
MSCSLISILVQPGFTARDDVLVSLGTCWFRNADCWCPFRDFPIEMGWSVMNYVDKIVVELGKKLTDCPVELLRLYALMVLMWGEAVIRRDVHDAWSVWCTGINPNHKSLIPYDELSAEVRALDEPYAEAIRQVAKDMDLS